MRSKAKEELLAIDMDGNMSMLCTVESSSEINENLAAE